jgi:hypothetical protein
VKVQLLHVYGDVDPMLVGKPVKATDKAVREAVLRLMRSKSIDTLYDPEGGTFMLLLSDDGKLKGVDSFSGAYMDALRKEAEIKRW